MVSSRNRGRHKLRRSGRRDYECRPGDVAVRLRCSGQQHLIVYRPDDKRLVLVDHDLRLERQESAFHALGGTGGCQCLAALAAWRAMKPLGRRPERRDIRRGDFGWPNGLPRLLFDMRVRQKKKHPHQCGSDWLCPKGCPVKKEDRTQSWLLRERVKRLVEESPEWQMVCSARKTAQYESVFDIETSCPDSPRHYRIESEAEGCSLSVDAGRWLREVAGRGLFPLANTFLIHVELYNDDCGFGVGYSWPKLSERWCYTARSNRIAYWLTRHPGSGVWSARPLRDSIL
jgi:hypothetical protein